MEEEVIKPVLNEVLQELKELKQEQAETIKVVFEIKDRVKIMQQNITKLCLAEYFFGCLSSLQ